MNSRGYIKRIKGFLKKVWLVITGNQINLSKPKQESRKRTASKRRKKRIQRQIDTCRQKVMYSTFDKAYLAASSVKYRKGWNQRVYYCRYCNHYHLTSKAQ